MAKLATLRNGSVGRLEDGDALVELACGSMVEYFERAGHVEETGRVLSLTENGLAAPIVPRKFFHTAGNFPEHHEDMASSGAEHPVNKGIVFFQNIDAIIGPNEPIVYPGDLTSELDYELELTVVIGKSGKFLSPDEALDYIAGYLIFNDITARDIQRREMKSGVFSYSKAIDTFCPLGPWIVTPDEIDDPYNLNLELRVNGEVRQQSNTRNMTARIHDLLSYHSAQVFRAGDLLSLGTVSGVAAAADDPQAAFLKPGDVVEAEIEGIGTLRNPVVTADPKVKYSSIARVL